MNKRNDGKALEKNAPEKKALVKKTAEKKALAKKSAEKDAVREKTEAVPAVRVKTNAQVDPTRMPGFCGYVLRKDGKYLSAVAYSEGKSIPYWQDELNARASDVKIWKRLDAARSAMVSYGGTLRAVRTGNTGRLCRIWGWSEEVDTSD